MDFDSEEESQGEGGEEKIVPVMKENGTSLSLWFRMDAKRLRMVLVAGTTTVQKPTSRLPHSEEARQQRRWQRSDVPAWRLACLSAASPTLVVGALLC